MKEKYFDFSKNEYKLCTYLSYYIFKRLYKFYFMEEDWNISK